ncbi:MAG: 3-isopropylmalate dehydratase small subunit [Candidatus Omnitrophica bacterium]|nr:3-isopropylmalate dehydratase small subunit [Candidatus Omnitrophota bacterium]
MKLQGRAYIFGNSINTDEIIPAKYLKTLDKNLLGRCCMSGIDKDFSKKIKKGDIIVAGKNFGCGSSREQAPIAIKASGISCVIANSFARIFFRNCINIGLPILEVREKLDIKNQDLLEIDLRKGGILNKSKNKIYQATKFPQFLEGIIKTGGFIEWVRKTRAEK